MMSMTKKGNTGRRQSALGEGLDAEIRSLSAEISSGSSSAQVEWRKFKKLVREWKRRQQPPRITFSNWEPKGQTPLWIDPSPATSRPTPMCGRRPE